jgi:hypothetical protein
MDERRWEKLFPDFEYGGQTPPEPRLSRRHVAKLMPASARVHSKEEVVAGLSAQEALEECRRCLRCDLRSTVTVR